MGWFSRKQQVQETEKRNYTSQIIQSLEASVKKDGSNPGGLSSIQACAGLWARAMSVANVEPANALTKLLTPKTLYDIGRSMLLNGEIIYLIRNTNNGINIHACSEVDIQGQLDWTYRCVVSGPTSDLVVNVGSDSVIHPRINATAKTPHQGGSPALVPFTSTDLASAIEFGLKEEAEANHGYVLPAPTEGLNDEDLGLLKDDLRELKGRTALVPTMQKGWSDGQNVPGASNWNPRRIGINPEEGLVTLQENINISILGACGVPPELLSGRASDTGRREAWRQFLHGTIQPTADIVAYEFSEKLETNITFNFNKLFASDIQGRARAFNSLTSGGLSLADAGIATGITVTNTQEN